MKRRALFTVLAALAVVAASFAVLTSHAASASASPRSTSRTFYVTLYGWPDNSPPGADIAYPKSDGYPTLHDSAGGSGTYGDPITYATDKSELAVGTKVYYPYLKKYFIMRTTASSATRTGPVTGRTAARRCTTSTSGSAARAATRTRCIDCEDALTRSGTVVVDPPSNEPVSSTPLFDSSTNTCYSP